MKTSSDSKVLVVVLCGQGNGREALRSTEGHMDFEVMKYTSCLGRLSLLLTSFFHARQSHADVCNSQVSTATFTHVK